MVNDKEMNERAAREQAKKHGWDIETVRVCPECGRTVRCLHDQKVGCTCKPHGPPMVVP